jgi:hypothetical protein
MNGATSVSARVTVVGRKMGGGVGASVGARVGGGPFEWCNVATAARQIVNERW